MSTAKVLAIRLNSTISNGIRTVQSGFVEKTDQWTRVHMDPSIQKQFEIAATQRIGSLKPETTAVALQETPHKSHADNRTHWTGVELNAAGTVVVKFHVPTK